jgi:hypothetical protein
LEEKDLTEKQREWLELSRKIGPGALTKTEREALEKAYAKLLPREQQDLYEYLMATCGKKNPEDSGSAADAEDPISQMQKKVWNQPSHALKSAFSRIKATRPPTSRDRS